jgi:hypothetical protein
MKRIVKNTSWFTMIELMVSLTIFTIAIFLFSRVVSFDFLFDDSAYKVLQNTYGTWVVYSDSEWKKFKIESNVDSVIMDISKDGRLNDLPEWIYSVKNSTMILLDPSKDFTKNMVKKVLFKSN